MMRFSILTCLLLIVINSFSQSLPSDIFMDNQSIPYLEHTVGAKENFYSIGRMYNLSPKVIAPYNKLDLATSGLSIGQKIKIPLNASNFWQTGTRTAQEVIIPLHYKLTSQSSLSAVAKLFNADVAELKSWNQGVDNDLIKDTRVIVGFLKVDKTLSSLASQAAPVRKDPVVIITPQPDVKTNDQDQKQQAKADEKKTVKVDEKKTPTPPVKKDTLVTPGYIGEGFFKDEYETQLKASSGSKTESGTGSVFKSSSGWSDGKYYLIADGIERGTIVLVKHTVSGKIIYAKVLAGLQEVKPDTKEKFILSEAGVAQLGIKGSDFSVEIIWAVE